MKTEDILNEDHKDYLKQKIIKMLAEYQAHDNIEGYIMMIRDDPHLSMDDPVFFGTHEEELEHSFDRFIETNIDYIRTKTREFQKHMLETSWKKRVAEEEKDAKARKK